jgi:hypothetical protein
MIRFAHAAPLTSYVWAPEAPHNDHTPLLLGGTAYPAPCGPACTTPFSREKCPLDALIFVRCWVFQQTFHIAFIDHYLLPG